MRIYVAAIIGFALLAGGGAHAEQRSLYVIYDSSNSMWGELDDGTRKYEAARDALSAAVTAEGSISLRAYGHSRAGDCRDSELLIEASAASADAVQAIQGLRPTGKTPISYSLREARKDLGDEGEILLISDGIETCDVDPCELVNDWRAAGVRIRVHVVGVGLNELERGAMQCIADAGNGQYFDARTGVELQEAIGQADDLPPPQPRATDDAASYVLLLSGADDQDRGYVLGGDLYRNGERIDSLTSNGRNLLPGPGTYDIEVGALLRDGSVYEPTRQTVTISAPGETRERVIVAAPARVSATFTTAGEPVRGALVSAWRDGEEAFRFRSFDEVLARPGDYQFRSQPNADNALEVGASLVVGQHTVVAFELRQTVMVLFRYPLFNGEFDPRTGELYQGDDLRYSVSPRRLNRVLPGEYELRDKFSDPLNPLAPRAVSVGTAPEQTIDVPMEVGLIETHYAGAERDFINPKVTRVFIHAIDPQTGESRGSVTSATGRVEVAVAGRYRVEGHRTAGYFAPATIEVSAGESVTATVVAQPVAEVSVIYAPGDYERTPDRAFLEPLDGQQPRKTYMTPGTALKVPPGRYRIRPHGVSDVAPLEFALSAGEVRALVFPR
ncbi:MAG: hypothetical protein AAF515_06520 [Pseudomonadota bacterium]